LCIKSADIGKNIRIRALPRLIYGGIILTDKFDKNHYQNGLDMPLGLSMVLAQNPLAFGAFSRLSPKQRESLVHSVRENTEARDTLTGKSAESHRFD
jgi:hypothetical protein